MSYAELSDEAKLETAIKFIATSQPLPKELEEFLKQENLYDAVMSPTEDDE